LGRLTVDRRWVVYSCGGIRMGSGEGRGERQKAPDQLHRSGQRPGRSAVDDLFRTRLTPRKRSGSWRSARHGVDASWSWPTRSETIASVSSAP